jgi:YVTN family beta-propeller protein
MMIPHHQAAMEVAKVELQYGTDRVMRRLAQEIVADQQSEINAVHLWLTKTFRNGKGREIDTMLRELVLFGLSAVVAAAQAGDRVYNADQTSNTVSVIDPHTKTLLGTIRLGEDVPAPLSTRSCHPASSRRWTWSTPEHIG